MAVPAEATLAPIVLTMGDPAGIGPEMAARAWEARERAGGGRDGDPLPPFLLVGQPEAVTRVWSGPVARIDDPARAADVFADALPVLAVGEGAVPPPGRPDAHGAGLALAALEAGIGLVRGGAGAALVTGPVAKHALYAVGFTHPGQTEFVAERCGVTPERAAMMLLAGSLRVVPLTIHLPLRAVPDALTPALIEGRARVVARALARDFGIAAPRLALAGLNPHAGEDGALGAEEAAVMAPAVARLIAEGLTIEGPLAADALFAPHVRTRYDAILCAYHDQALTPFKALAFDSGVNMTLGLPIVRTSADHGTAYGLAGTGAADPGPTIAAIRAAADAVRHRRAAAAVAPVAVAG